MTKIAAAIEGLKGNPIALALVIINLAFMTTGVWVLRDIGEVMRERENRNMTLFKECLDNNRRG